jgi:hypothetical protein
LIGIHIDLNPRILSAALILELEPKAVPAPRPGLPANTGFPEIVSGSEVIGFVECGIKTERGSRVEYDRFDFS